MLIGCAHQWLADHLQVHELCCQSTRNCGWLRRTTHYPSAVVYSGHLHVQLNCDRNTGPESVRHHLSTGASLVRLCSTEKIQQRSDLLKKVKARLLLMFQLLFWQWYSLNVCFPGDVFFIARGERHSVWDGRPGQIPLLHTLGTAGLRCSVFGVAKVSYDSSYCIVSMSASRDRFSLQGGSRNVWRLHC